MRLCNISIYKSQHILQKVQWNALKPNSFDQIPLSDKVVVEVVTNLHNCTGGGFSAQGWGFPTHVISDDLSAVRQKIHQLGHSHGDN